MKIKHVVAVVAQIFLDVETDSIHDFFLSSLDVKGEKNQHPEPRQRGNATSPHPLSRGCCQVNKLYPTSFRLTLCNAIYGKSGRFEVAWFVNAQHSEAQCGCTKHNVAQLQSVFSCAFGPMSMSSLTPTMDPPLQDCTLVSYRSPPTRLIFGQLDMPGFHGHLDRILAQVTFEFGRQVTSLAQCRGGHVHQGQVPAILQTLEQLLYPSVRHFIQL